MYRNTLETSFGKVSYLSRHGMKYLILLHGLGGVGNNFMKLASCLPDDIGLIFPDLLGHGHSPKIHYIKVTDQARMINELIDGLELKDFYIGGNSYGGWVALKYQTDYGKSKGLILMDNAGINQTVGDQGQESMDKFMERIMKVSPNNQMDIIREIVENNSGDRYKIKPDQLGAIDQRTLIIWGRNDRMIPLSYGVMQNQLIPNSTLKIIENGTHTPHISSSSTVCELIKNFLYGE